MLLVAILAILSGQDSLVGMERFAKRHHVILNELLGTDFGTVPSESTFRLLLSQLDVAGLESLLRDWMAAQPGASEGLDTLVCDGKTLRGSIAEPSSGAAVFIAQVSPYSQPLGVVIAQATYVSDAGSEPRPCGSCWKRWSSMGSWCRRMCCTPTLLFLSLAQRGVDFLIAVKQSRRKGFQLIRDRRTDGRRVAWRASRDELDHGRDITWTLRAMPAPEWVVEQWPGSATIIAVRSQGVRAGTSVDETRDLGTRLRTGAKILLRHVRQRWLIENSWHWVRNTQLWEDAHRYREENGVQILATLRSTAINVLRLDGICSIAAGMAALLTTSKQC